MYNGDTLEKGAIPKLDDMDATILMNDIKTKKEVEKNKMKIIYIKDIADINEYLFLFMIIHL